MRHLVAGGVLVVVALAVTFGIAAVLQDMAISKSPPSQDYAPPSIATPSGKPKAGEGSRVMLSRRMNDEQPVDRNEPASE
jgi:hypothetical protein